MTEPVLAVDVGTSSLKAVLFGGDGAVLAEGSAAYPTAEPEPGACEQDPDDWWRALGQAAAPCLAAGRPAALVFTGSMQNLVLTDATGRAIAPAVLYNDGRLDMAAVEALLPRLPADLAARSGNRPDPAQTVFRLLHRGVPDGATIHIGAKDVVAHRLTGRAATDAATATTSGLLAFRAGDWDEAILEAAGLTRGRLPEVLPGDGVVGTVTAEAAEATGLPVAVPVVCGAGDAAAAVWGAHADEPGRADVYVGTSGWVAATLALDALALPAPHYTLAPPVGDRAIAVAPFLSAGAALEFAADLAGLSLSEGLAAAADAAPDGPLLMPFLAGERSPFEDRAVRGALFGLSRTHRAGDIVRAAAEGVAFAVRHNLAALGLQPERISVSGGAAESPLVLQLLADALGAAVEVPAAPRLVTAYGAARLAWRALGLPAPPRPEPAAVVAPDPATAARTARRFAAYGDAVAAVRQISARLAPDRPG